jgi:serine/threonine protein kinase
MPLPAATRLGAYEIIAPLGAGGMGEVYRARDTRLSREVAVKVLPADVSNDPGRLARFEREARLVSTLNHPHIGVLFDVGQEGGTYYLVMELIEGESLADRLGRGALPVFEVLRIGAQIAEALDHAHQAGVVHRDIKPANVMLAKAGAKLVDFGLAQTLVRRKEAAKAQGLTQAETLAQSLTGAGSIVGTIPYMSPEQLDSREATMSSDVWALGCVLYEMATGRRAWDADSTTQTIAAILSGEPRPLAEVDARIPPGLDWVVRACLVKNPEQRWRSAHDLAMALQGPLMDLGGDAPRSGIVERHFPLSATLVRQLSERDPRLIGHPVTYLDNQHDSETLVILLHGIGGDARRFERTLATCRHRAVAITLAGFGPREAYRPALSFDDHSRVVRALVRHVVLECRPKTTVLVGFSAGSDQFLRMLEDTDGAGADVQALIALAPNVSIETCFASRVYADIDPTDPAGMLESLRTLGSHIGSLQTWLVLQHYLSQTFIKLGADLEPLRRYAVELIEPFRQPESDPLAGWYRRARKRIPRVRMVFSHTEAGPARALLTRHLERNVLGDAFTEDSFVFEPVHHVELTDSDLIARHLAAVLGEASA